MGSVEAIEIPVAIDCGPALACFQGPHILKCNFALPLVCTQFLAAQEQQQTIFRGGRDEKQKFQPNALRPWEDD
jgi:hypothetical protein